MRICINTYVTDRFFRNLAASKAKCGAITSFTLGKRSEAGIPSGSINIVSVECTCFVASCLAAWTDESTGAGDWAGPFIDDVSGLLCSGD